jgi:hypothetical protein
MDRSSALLRWSPRILGILVCAFLSAFSFDAFSGYQSLAQSLPDFARHVAPVLGLLGVVALSWRWAWVGGIVFTVLAAAYAYFARDHVWWVLVIAGPLFAVGALFLLSWRNGALRGTR